MKYIVCLLLFFLFSHLTFGQENHSNVCYLQILNGISDGPVDISIDGEVIFPSALPGQRITSVGLKSLEGEISIKKQPNGLEAKFPFKLKTGSYNTLILGGDFTRIKIEDSNSPLRLHHQFIENVFERNSSDIQVNFLNGLVDSEIRIFSTDNEVVRLAPLSSAGVKVSGVDLILTCKSNGKTRKLYLAQTGVFRNLAIVFFPTSLGLGFKAMVEHTAQAAAIDANPPN